MRALVHYGLLATLDCVSLRGDDHKDPAVRKEDQDNARAIARVSLR